MPASQEVTPQACPRGLSPDRLSAMDFSRYLRAMDRSSLYDDDIYAWAQQQADVLRRLAATGRDLPNDLDLEHVAEEIEDVGKAEFNASQNHIRQIFIHLIKLASEPQSRAARHWRSEIVNHHAQLLGRVTRSMHPRIDLDKLWNRAARQAAETLIAKETATKLTSAKPGGAPLSIEELAVDEFDIDGALAKLGAAIEG